MALTSPVAGPLGASCLALALFLLSLAPPCWGMGSSSSSEFTLEERGQLNTLSYVAYFRDGSGTHISPFHDIPLYQNKGQKIFNMVVEIPRWTSAKMEIMTKKPLNPIMQDTKNGKLRYVANIFPFHGYMWNYGALPQTWENPGYIDLETNLPGDNDPIDVCEIGRRVAKRGEVIQVKILGVVGLLDEGETDWKLIVIDVKDPLASQLNDIADVEPLFPGLLDATVEWFRIYKVPKGKPENEFAFNGEARDREFALKMLEQTHDQWRALVDGKTPPGDLYTAAVTYQHAKVKLTAEEVEGILAMTESASRDPEDDRWYFMPPLWQ